MSVYVVTDLGFGDCGKGSIVDFLARQSLGTSERCPAVVVRHCGGPQAGHNVVTDGEHHTFAQFGAGSLAGGTTFLSRYVLVSPLNMELEAEHLIELGQSDIWQRTYIDEDALVITPFHVAMNRIVEMARRGGRHGSCGQGIGVTAATALTNPELALRVKHLSLGRDLVHLLEGVRQLLLPIALNIPDDPNAQMLTDEDLPGYLAQRYRDWYQRPQVVSSDHLGQLIKEHEHTVFEGAQGVLLDQDYGFHPYTTWSTTTHENALMLLREAGDYKPVRIGVIRAVSTRHGPGPFPTEDAALAATWQEPHNVDGPWQGAFRVGHLDLVMHNYAMRVCGGVDQIAVTHLDLPRQWVHDGRRLGWQYCDAYAEMPRIPLGRRGDLVRQGQLTERLMQVTPWLHEANEEEMLTAIEANLEAPVTIASYGPAATDKYVLSGVL